MLLRATMRENALGYSIKLALEEIKQNDKDDEDATEDNIDESFVDKNGISPIQSRIF